MVQTGALVARAGRKATRLRHGVPVLMYHLVSDEVPATFRKYTVTPERFRRQVATLVRLRCSSVSPAELLAAHRGEARLPPRPVVITFDDGFRDCLRHAAPVLHDAGLTATMYVVGGLLGGTSRWMREPEGLDLPLVSASEARELEQAGVRCESHGLTHARLARLTPDEVERELTQSRDVLEDALGHEIRHLAYPHGSYDDRVVDAVRDAGYLTAVTTQPGKVLPVDDRLSLPRVKVDGRERPVDFFTRLVTGRHLGHPLR